MLFVDLKFAEITHGLSYKRGYTGIGLERGKLFGRGLKHMDGT